MVRSAGILRSCFSGPRVIIQHVRCRTDAGKAMSELSLRVCFAPVTQNLWNFSRAVGCSFLVSSSVKRVASFFGLDRMLSPTRDGTESVVWCFQDVSTFVQSGYSRAFVVFVVYFRFHAPASSFVPTFPSEANVGERRQRRARQPKQQGQSDK